jgi:hypothetical protein
MVVIISNNVLETIGEYAEALTKYPISTSRARQKVDRLISALYSLGSSIMTPPICMYKDLLQTFDKQGNPINKNLKRFNYKDKSNFQWAFACLYDDENDTIIILKMMPSTSVKESLDKLINVILENVLGQYINENIILEDSRLRRKVRLTEGDLHRVIKQCVNQVLQYYM